MRLGALRSVWGRSRAAVEPAPRDASPHAQKTVYLSAIDIFRDLAPDDLDRLAARTTMVACRRGRALFRAGEPNEALFLLKRGRVQIVRESADGRRLVTAVLGPDTFFGEMALVGQRFPQDSTAVALEDTLVCVLSRHDLERLIEVHPRVGLRLLEHVSARLMEAEAAAEELAFKPVAARLAGALLRLAERDPAWTVHASHQELADMVASYRETVTLALNRFRDDGLVELERRCVRVVRPEGLRALAEG